MPKTQQEEDVEKLIPEVLKAEQRPLDAVELQKGVNERLIQNGGEPVDRLPFLFSMWSLIGRGEILLNREWFAEINPLARKT